MMNQEVYSRLYDVVQANMDTAGGKFPYEKETFLCDVGAHPQEIDISGYLKLSNPAFMQAVHVAALKRLPEERIVTFWEQRYGEEREQFQEEVLRSIANSSVVAINQIRIIHNPYFEQKRGVRYHALGLLYGLTDKSSLREFGKKLPMPVQKIIRKVFI
ncbi:MAG: hypothetical protein J6B43_07975 [Lachnospiraceae bacterium]|nr:hypothetical protein [Lachnospiraceae bacterium]